MRSSSPFSFWLRMPGHEGAVPGSRYRRWRVPWVGRTRAVAPCLLCEVLAVIRVLRGGVCTCARSCVAPASGLWFLGASLPSTGFVVAMQVWACPVLLAWAVPCFSLGAWALGPAASSGAFRPSPSLGSVRRLVFWVRSPLPGNLSFRVRLRLIPSLPRAPCIFLPGLCRKRGWECWSGSSSTSLRAS